MRERVSPPEGVPRLFDLIQVPDRKILPAFFFALRHTLVCDGLDQVRGGKGGRVVPTRRDDHMLRPCLASR